MQEHWGGSMEPKFFRGMSRPTKLSGVVTSETLGIFFWETTSWEIGLAGGIGNCFSLLIFDLSSSILSLKAILVLVNFSVSGNYSLCHISSRLKWLPRMLNHMLSAEKFSGQHQKLGTF